MPRLAKYLLTPKGMRSVVQGEQDESIPTENQESAVTQKYEGEDMQAKPPKNRPKAPSVAMMISTMKRKKM